MGTFGSFRTPKRKYIPIHTPLGVWRAPGLTPEMNPSIITWLQTNRDDNHLGADYDYLYGDIHKSGVYRIAQKRASRPKTDKAVTPGGCTSLIQAPDGSWNKPFKAAYCEE